MSDNTKYDSDIHKKIDEIILKNREKLEKIQKETIDIENISLKNKKGDTLYYLRKKIDKNDAEKEVKPRNKHKKLKFGKIKKGLLLDKEPNIDLTKDSIESKISEKDFSKIDNIIKNKIQEKSKIDKEKFEKKKTEESYTLNKDSDDIGEKIAAELAKKHDFFSTKKFDDYKVLKDHTFDSDKIDDFISLLNKYKGKLMVTNLVYSNDDSIIENIENKENKENIENIENIEDKENEKNERFIEPEETFSEDLGKEIKIDEKIIDEIKKTEKTINEDIKETKKPDEKISKYIKKKDKPDEILKSEIKKEKEIKKETPPTPSQKKSFLKIKKKKIFEKKDQELKETKIQEKPPTSTPMFRVDNIPDLGGIDEDEANLIDKKITESEKQEGKKIDKKPENEALKFASKHLKNKTPSKNENQIDPMASSINKTISSDDDHEHIFFDEEGASASGWSPQLLEKGRRMVPSAGSARGEISSEDLKDVGEVELPKDVLQTKSVKLSELGFSEKEWHELDFYSLQEPFAYVEILQEKENLDKCYFLVEIALSQEEEELLSFIRETMSYQDIDPFELEEKNEDEYLLEQLNNVIKEYNIEINEESKNKIYYYMRKTSLGMGKIDPFMRDPHIEDISCDGAGIPVFLYHRKFGSLKSNIRFDIEDELSSFVFKLAQKCNKHISIAEPMIDATMPDGSRIQMTLSDEITTKGSTFTIRKFRADPFSPPDLVEFNTMSSEMIAYMWFAIENGVNTLFAGGTASGKTTALNALSLFIPRESKIVSIEETREINLPHPNWIPGVARSGFGEVVADKMVGEIDMYDLMKAALRQRPEYILVGEIRGREAYVLFQAMATGHATYSTVHADSAQSLIHRLEGKPINIPRIMLQAMDIVCLHVITRVKNFRARRCKQIIEIIDIDPTTKEILTNEVFRWDPVDDKFKYSGKSYVLERIRAEKDLSRDGITNEIKNRMKLVEWMNKTNIREFREVANIVTHYNEDPKETLKKIDKEVKK